jgi:hypothetical protein
MQQAITEIDSPISMNQWATQVIESYLAGRRLEALLVEVAPTIQLRSLNNEESYHAVRV